MAHWLNWCLGTSLHAAREQVRVGRVLRSLPVLRAAFAPGELSYSYEKLRSGMEDHLFGHLGIAPAA